MEHYDLSQMEERELFPGYRGKFIHTDNMTLVYWTIEANAPLPPHSHPHEQVVNMLSGEFELTVEGKSQVLKPGMVAVIPGGAEHTGRPLTRCHILDIFHPVREEYKD
ncbi:MAG: cupin domain-containing protein [Caldilineae bacterium]|nr:MAG: cupin domain-containing protein [Caldilineae bacterium]